MTTLICRGRRADDQHLSDAGDGLQPAAQGLVGVLGDVALDAGTGDGDGDDGDGAGIEVLDDRRLGVVRQVAEDGVDLVAHFLRGDVAVLLEVERRS